MGSPNKLGGTSRSAPPTLNPDKPQWGRTAWLFTRTKTVGRGRQGSAQHTEHKIMRVTNTSQQRTDQLTKVVSSKSLPLLRRPPQPSGARHLRKPPRYMPVSELVDTQCKIYYKVYFRIHTVSKHSY